MVSQDHDNDGIPEVYLGGVVTEPALTDEEWAEICSSLTVTLTPVDQERINQQLWWCQLSKQKLETIPRPGEIKRRLRKFIKGVDSTLGAIGYLRAAELKSALDRPPIDTHIRSLPDGQAWLALSNAALSDTWRHGYWTKRALERASSPDEVLLGLHALAFAAGRALVEWQEDKGGMRSGGDVRFIEQLLRILMEAGVEVSYQHERNPDDGDAGMSGVGWCILVAIWSRRIASFTSQTEGTLAKYYRDAYAKLT